MDRQQLLAGGAVVLLIAGLVGVNYLFVPSSEPSKEQQKKQAERSKAGQKASKTPRSKKKAPKRKQPFRQKQKKLKKFKKAAQQLSELGENSKLVSVNGQTITFGDVEDEYEKRLQNIPSSVRKQGQTSIIGVRLLQQLTNKKVNRTLFVSKAKEEGFTVSEDEVRSVHKTIRTSFKNEDFYQMAIGQEDMSDTQFRKRIRKELLVQKLVKANVPDTEPTETEKKHFYDSMDTHPQRPERLHLYHMFVPKAAQGRERAEKAADTLRDGEDFSGVADQYAKEPDNYDIGYVTRKDINDTYSKQIFAMTPDDIAGPIETSRGYHIFKAIDHKEAGPVTYEEIKGEIATRIKEQRRRGVLRSILTKLREKADITYHRSFLDPDQASP